MNQMVLGKRTISAATALALETALPGLDAEHLLNLQKTAQLRLELDIARGKVPAPEVQNKARLVSAYPLREMIRRGWIDGAKDVSDEIATFFGVSKLDDVPHLAHAAKKTDYSDIPPAQLAWLYRVRAIARGVAVPKYSPERLNEALPRLQRMMIEPEEARHVARTLAECGVRFVIAQALPSAKIDGVAFWIDGPGGASSAPVIGMSLRFDRIDGFWFTLRHEIEHVLQGHGRVAPMVDVELEGERIGTGDGLPAEERIANQAATDFCVPKAQMDSWIARKAPYFAEQDLIGFAKRLAVHPGIVAGQLRHRTGNYKLFTRHLVKVQHAIAPSAIVDGWGTVAPAFGERPMSP